MSGFLATPIAGSQIHLDGDLDGFAEQTLDEAYNRPNHGLAGEFFLLTINPGQVPAYWSNGPVSTTFDWALTAYEEPVLGQNPSDPIGSAMYGTAVFESGRTLLLVSQGLLWVDGLEVGDWAGYNLTDIAALELTQSGAGQFTLTTTTIPSPSGLLCLMLAGAARAGRRR